MRKPMKYFIMIMLICTLLITALTGCGAKTGGANIKNDYSSSIESDDLSDNEGFFEKDSYEKEEESSDRENSSSGDYEERKIVYTVTTDLQTKDFEGAMKILNTQIEDNGGYIQSQKQTNDGGINSKYSHRTLTMVVRIPSENLENFLSGLENENIHTLSLSKDSQDYSSVYYDKEIRIESLEIQEERLLDMLSNATDLATMLELEKRLSDIRYEIESLTKEINFIDSNVAYSTITIYMNEVVEYIETVEEPKNLGERIAEAFRESWKDFYDGLENFVVWLVYALPTFLVLAIIVVAFSVCIIRLRKRTQRKYLNKDSSNSESSESTNSKTNP